MTTKLDKAKLDYLLTEANLVVAKLQGMRTEANSLCTTPDSMSLKHTLTMHRRAAAIMRDEAGECAQLASLLRRIADMWEPYLEESLEDIAATEKKGFE